MYIYIQIQGIQEKSIAFCELTVKHMYMYCLKPEVCSAERTLAIVRMHSLLNYSEHCRLEAIASTRSAEQTSGLLTRLWSHN
jgi:hypothetical protein